MIAYLYYKRFTNAISTQIILFESLTDIVRQKMASQWAAKLVL